jgi:hypothetical protein
VIDAYDFCKKKQCFDNSTNKTDWQYIFCGEYTKPKSPIKWIDNPKTLAVVVKRLNNAQRLPTWYPVIENFLIKKPRGTDFEKPTMEYMSKMATNGDTDFERELLNSSESLRKIRNKNGNKSGNKRK